jgi:hypothetical protein
LLGALVKISLAACADALYFIEPKEIVKLGLTVNKLQLLYMLSRFAAE